MKRTTVKKAATKEASVRKAAPVPKAGATKPAAAKKASARKAAPAKKAASAERATVKKARAGRRYSPAASASVEREMKAMKQGRLRSSSGQKVTNPKQAIAIALSEARREGDELPPDPNERH